MPRRERRRHAVRCGPLIARVLGAAILPICIAVLWSADFRAGPRGSASLAAYARTGHAAVAAPYPSGTGSAAPLSWRRHDDVNAGWSGYTVPGGLAAGNYTSAQGTWIVPSVSWVNYPKDPRGRTIMESSSAWIGIGGWGESVLIQLGTEQDVFHDDTTQKSVGSYYAWYELYPASPVTIDATRFTVQPGDTITAALQCTAVCKPGGQSTWTMSMMDLTRWKTPFTIQVQNPHTVLATAEWIMEANGAYCGSSCDLTLATFSYLPDFQKVTFSGLTANGANPGLSRAKHGIMIVDPEGKSWSTVSDPVGGNAFTVSFAPSQSP